MALQRWSSSGRSSAYETRGKWLRGVVFYERRDEVRAVWDYTELRYPHPYLVEIRPGTLRDALVQRLHEAGGEPPQLNTEVTGLALDGDTIIGVRYRDAAGRELELEASCVVGADGPDSAVRAAAGIDCHRLADPDRYLLGTVDVDVGADELSV